LETAAPWQTRLDGVLPYRELIVWPLAVVLQSNTALTGDFLPPKLAFPSRPNRQEGSPAQYEIV